MTAFRLEEQLVIAVTHLVLLNHYLCIFTERHDVVGTAANEANRDIVVKKRIGTVDRKVSVVYKTAFVKSVDLFALYDVIRTSASFPNPKGQLKRLSTGASR